MIDKFLEAMDEGKEYDFIANFYTSMSTFELSTILLEYIYAVHSSGIEDIQDNVRNELEEKEIFG
jgi:hypothetical protein